MWTLLRDSIGRDCHFRLMPSFYEGSGREVPGSAAIRRDFYLEVAEVQGPEQLSMFAHYKTSECKVEWLYWRWF